MLQNLANFTSLTGTEFAICAGAVFLAGVVRGFAGFALSAIVMASVVVVLPPVELIPVCYVLEGAASLAMLRGGVKNADMSVVWVLAIGSATGVPIGLFATTTIPLDLSKMVALFVILSLTMLQLFRISPRFVGTRGGLYGTGLVAGIATGLASVGGMVVALYVLASKSEPRTMRASLVMFLFIGMFTSLIYLLLYGVMDKQAVLRGAVFTPVVLLGVFVGSFFFRPRLAGFYKQFCLLLLVALSGMGLFRMIGA
ncbi:MAG: sulfite exporter TauE/SafE family protein [Rhodobacteraceae bacterium]|nr:sulfite exporter TauE/SafE family protein [Paracoccaceae bacterium]